MADLTSETPPSTETLTRGYLKNSGLLQIRVNDAATLMQEKGIAPTVRRIRAALGGGSPNDLTPALKHWRDVIFPTLSQDVQGATSTTMVGAIPPQLADLVTELWQRATAAAMVELKGGALARAIADRSEETYALRVQIASLRDQLQRESLAYGELRAQSARHEAMSREALARAQDAETRERAQLRDIGTAKQRVAELKAALAVRPYAKHLAKRLEKPPKKATPSKRRARKPATSHKPPLRRHASVQHRAKRRPQRKPK
jgi:hypothetical protein